MAAQSWMDAAEVGDVRTLQSLLSTSPTLLNARLPHQTFKQSTALHLAVWKGRSHAVEFLIDHGADIELQDQTGMTALQIDVLRICLQKMRPTMLLRSRCIDFQSPVAMAISKRKQVRDRSTHRDIDTSVLDLLLDHNARVDQPNESGDTPLLYAAEYGLTKHVEKLLAHGADANVQDDNGRSAMDIAGEHGFVDIVNVLIDKCPSLVNTVGVEFLVLLSSTDRSSWELWTGALQDALTNTVTSLCLCEQDKTLVVAVQHEYLGILETLYDRVHDEMPQADGEELGGRLLHIATEYDAPSCALFLLKRGISTDWTDSEGKTAVQVACARGRPEILDMLLDQSSATDIDNADIKDETSSGVATLTHPSVKMDVFQNCSDSDFSFLHDHQHSRFPVFVAVQRPANLEIMEVLIRHSAKFDFPTHQSRDSIAPLLASWLLCVAPSDALKLLVELANSGCLRHKLGHVILALTWQDYTHEALLLALLNLFSPQNVNVEQALAVFKPWMLRCKINLATQTLLTDALRL